MPAADHQNRQRADGQPVARHRKYEGATRSVPERDISPKSARESKNNYAKLLLRIWGSTHRKSRWRVVRGGWPPTSMPWHPSPAARPTPTTPTAIHLHRTACAAWCSAGVTQRVEGGLTYTQTFDAENRLISVTMSGQTTQFIYDGDGNLVKKVKPDNSKTIYVGGIYEVDKTSGGSVTRTVTYYPVAGAMRINSTLYYTLKDHLGSASVVTDASGNVVGENRYYPYGETRLTTGTIFTDKLFTRWVEPVEGAER